MKYFPNISPLITPVLTFYHKHALYYNTLASLTVGITVSWFIFSVQFVFTLCCCASSHRNVRRSSAQSHRFFGCGARWRRQAVQKGTFMQLAGTSQRRPPCFTGARSRSAQLVRRLGHLPLRWQVNGLDQHLVRKGYVYVVKTIILWLLEAQRRLERPGWD